MIVGYLSGSDIKELQRKADEELDALVSDLESKREEYALLMQEIILEKAFSFITGDDNGRMEILPRSETVNVCIQRTIR